MDELKKKIEELGCAFEEFKKANDKRLEEIKTKGYASGELETKVSKISDDMTGMESKLQELNAALARSSKDHDKTDQDAEEKAQWKKYREACTKFMRKGVQVPNELVEFARTSIYGKTMSVDSDEDGGFLVTPEMATTMIEKVFESSPIRQLATVQTISSDSFDIIQDLDEVSSGWVGENQARPATNTAQFNKINVPVHELYAFPFATQKFLDDAGINVESWLAGKVSAKFARDEATAFVSGNGVAKPKGILDYASGTSFGQIEYTTTASPTALTGDELIDLQSSLKEPYQNNATWLINRLLIGYIRKLKDTQNQYLWQPGLGQGVPPQLLGRPVMMASDLPSTITASSKLLMYGDVKAGYIVVDRIGIRVLRDAYTNKPYVGFYTTKRVGGAVQNFEAIKVLQAHA